MPFTRLGLASAALVLATACGSGARSARGCQSAADCGEGVFCRQSRCVAGEAPTAVIAAPPAPLESHTVLHFDGSASADPDPEDHVASWGWTVRKLTADCDPFPRSGTGTALDVVFGCAGAFEVALSVVDGTGQTSAPALLPLDVRLSSLPPPSVEMNPDYERDHLCAGTPLRCLADTGDGSGVLSLGARATSPVSSKFTMEWSVELPALPPGSPAPTVALPGAGPSGAASATIATDGTAIAGDYVFTVRATDEWNLVAVGHQRIRILNRPPVVGGGGTVRVPHTFDAAGSRFLATGSLGAPGVADPDGDPIRAQGFTATATGAGPSTFELRTVGGNTEFTVAVPYATQADAAYLIGAPGLSRGLVYGAEDVNGGRGEAVWAVQIDNRPPRLAARATSASVDHAYDRATGNYLATAPLGSYVDDDGDPILQRGDTGDAGCPVLAPVIGAGTPMLQCRMASGGRPRVHLFAGSNPVQVVVGDPWSALPAESFALTVQNRPPRLADSPAVNASCSLGTACCDFDTATRTCLLRAEGNAAGTASAPPPVVDDDGDPLDVTLTGSSCASVAPAAVTCNGVCPAVTFSLCARTPTCAPLPTIQFAVTDGAASASGSRPLGHDPACQ
jgi:hypothetical protein